jgi:hypothetical protein
VLLLLSAEARRAFPQLVAAGVLAGSLTIPLTWPYAAVGREMGLRDPSFIMFLFIPWIIFPPFHEPVTYLADRLARGVRQNVTMTMAPWLAMAAGLLASAVVRRPRLVPGAMLAALVAGGLVNFWYACGPQEWFGIPSLFTALADLPGLGVVRAPARAVAYTNFVIAVLGGCGMAAVLRRVGGGPVRAAVVAVVLATAVVEAGWHPGGVVAAPLRDPAVTRGLAALPPDCPIAEIPDDFLVQGRALFRSTAHWRPLVNGRSGFYPISPFVEAGFLNRFPEAPAVEYLRAAGACAVIIHTDTRTGPIIVKNSRARQLAVRALTPSESVVRVPELPPPPPAAPRLERTSWRIVEPAAAAGPLLDGSLATLAEFAVGTGEPLERVTVDLGRPALVSGLDVELGSHFRHYLWTYRVEGSLDGTHWTTLGESAGAVPPLESYRADPHALVQRLRFPAAEARFLRLGPVRPAPTGYVLAMDAGFKRWGIAELHVRGVPASPAPDAPC